MSSRALADRVDDVLRPTGQLDVLLLYGVAAESNAAYLGDRELASKVHIPGGPTLLKRGSDREPLMAAEVVAAVDEKFLERRTRPGGLEDARDALTDAQRKVWQYFPPRKYCEFLYATNREGEGGPIDRIFYDLDRGPDVSAEQALEVTRAFVEFLESDPAAEEVTETTVISFTGNSFHVDLLLSETRPPEFYEEEIFTTEEREVDTITDRGVRALQSDIDVPVVGGHVRRPDVVNVDPSQTPSGKLNRVPLGSLHMADAETVDGVSVPVGRDELFEEGVLDRLTAYTPRKLVDDVDELAAKLP